MGKEQRDMLTYRQSICALTTKDARKYNLHGLSLLFCVRGGRLLSILHVSFDACSFV